MIVGKSRGGIYYIFHTNIYLLDLMVQNLVDFIYRNVTSSVISFA